MRKRIAMVLALVMSICSISTVNASTYYMIYCNGQYWEDLKDVRDEIIIPEDNVVSRTVIEVQYTENHFGGGGITGYSDSKKRGVPEPPNKYTMIEPEYIYDYPLSEVKRLLNEWADRNGIEKKTFEYDDSDIQDHVWKERYVASMGGLVSTTKKNEQTGEIEEIPAGSLNKVVSGSSVNVTLTIGSKIIKVNGSEIPMDVAPYIQEGSDTTLVPLRFVITALSSMDENTSLEWDGENKAVTIRVDGKIIKFYAGSGWGNIDGKYNPLLNGSVAEIKDGRMYIPFVSLGESLDINVTWNAENKSVTFVKEGKQKNTKTKATIESTTETTTRTENGFTVKFKNKVSEDMGKAINGYKIGDVESNTFLSEDYIDKAKESWRALAESGMDKSYLEVAENGFNAIRDTAKVLDEYYNLYGEDDSFITAKTKEYNNRFMKLSEGIAYGKTVDLAVSSYNGLLELRNEILKSYNN